MRIFPWFALRISLSRVVFATFLVGIMICSKPAGARAQTNSPQPQIRTFGDITIKIEPGHAESDKDIAGLENFIKKIRPELENYIGRSMAGLTIEVGVDLPSGFAGRSLPDKNTLQLISASPTLYFVTIHEMCHLAQYPLNYPGWFEEGQAYNCQEKFQKLAGIYDKKFFDSLHQPINPNVKIDLSDSTWLKTKDDKYRDASALSYLLMKNIFAEVDWAKFFSRAREDFKGYSGLLPNEAVICKMNEVSGRDFIPVFEQNGFKLEPCGKNTYDFLKKPINPAVIVIAAAAGLMVALYLVAILARRNKGKK